MHELSICKNLFDLITAQVSSTQRIKAVHISVGQLTAIDINALQFAFNISKQNTFLEQAELIIQIIQGQARCTHCDTINKIAHYYDACHACGKFSFSILDGENLQLTTLEIEPCAGSAVVTTTNM